MKCIHFSRLFRGVVNIARINYTVCTYASPKFKVGFAHLLFDESFWKIVGQCQYFTQTSSSCYYAGTNSSSIAYAVPNDFSSECVSNYIWLMEGVLLACHLTESDMI